MSPPVNRIPSDERLPEAVDAVVIGGGVIGVSSAYHLARKGLSVALVEKGHVAGEQSSRNWGWCRQQGRARAEIPTRRFAQPEEIALAALYLASDGAAMVNGANLLVDGGYTVR